MNPAALSCHQGRQRHTLNVSVRWARGEKKTIWSFSSSLSIWQAWHNFLFLCAHFYHWPLSVWIFRPFISACLSSTIQFFFFLSDWYMSKCDTVRVYAAHWDCHCDGHFMQQKLFFLSYIPEILHKCDYHISEKNHRENQRDEGWLTASYGTHETSHMTVAEYHVRDGFLESLILVTSLRCLLLNLK